MSAGARSRLRAANSITALTCKRANAPARCKVNRKPDWLHLRAPDAAFVTGFTHRLWKSQGTTGAGQWPRRIVGHKGYVVVSGSSTEFSVRLADPVSRHQRLRATLRAHTLSQKTLFRFSVVKSFPHRSFLQRRNMRPRTERSSHTIETKAKYKGSAAICGVQYPFRWSSASPMPPASNACHPSLEKKFGISFFASRRHLLFHADEMATRTR
jgi:hypothetical protein